jgi:hypothetical protein
MILQTMNGAILRQNSFNERSKVSGFDFILSIDVANVFCQLLGKEHLLYFRGVIDLRAQCILEISIKIAVSNIL